jgi:hypothetical protein
MSRDEYVDIPQLFENHIDKAQYYPDLESESYTHTISTLDSGVDIIRSLPWLEELTITTGLAYDPAPTPEERLLFDTYFVKPHVQPFFDAMASKLFARTSQLIILGETGGGKTTAINYLYRHSAELQEYRQRHYIVLITCNTDYALISHDQTRRLTLADFVAVRLSEAMHKAALDYNCTVDALFQDIAQRPLARGIQEAMKRLSSGHTDALLEPRIYQHLLEGENYNNRLFQWFETNHPELTIDIVVDNLDCFPRDERNDCISKLLHMCRRSNTKLILPLRYSTYVEYEHTDALYLYGASEIRLPLNSPGFRHIVRCRLEKIPNKVKLTNLGDWQNRMKLICRGLCSDEITEIFSGIFGEDSREKLKAVKAVLESPHVVFGGDYANSSKILEALMLGECIIPLPKFSHLINLFYNNESPGYQNALTLVRLLQIVGGSEPFYVRPAMYVQLLGNAGYEPRVIRNAINYLLRRGLLAVHDNYGVNRLPDDLERTETRLRLTAPGRFYLTYLLHHRTYLTLAAQSSYIPKKFTRSEDGEFVVDVVQREIRQERNVGRYLAKIMKKHGHEIFVPAMNFGSYLRELEESEDRVGKGALAEYHISDSVSGAIMGA